MGPRIWRTLAAALDATGDVAGARMAREGACGEPPIRRADQPDGGRAG
jgi:hypothetical protein